MSSFDGSELSYVKEKTIVFLKNNSIMKLSNQDPRIRAIVFFNFGKI